MQSRICRLPVIRSPRLLTIIVFDVLFSFLVGASFTDQIKWTLETYPALFGGNVKITCTIYDKKPPGHMAWTKCSGGQNKCTSGQTIAFNQVSADISKYVVKYHKQQMIYELVIQHFNITDVNCLYKCESGFNYALGEVSLDESVAIPKPDQIQKTYNLTDERMQAIIRIQQVYPRPRCAAVFKGKNITDRSNTTCIEQGILYLAVVEVFYETKECAGNLSIPCIVGIRNITMEHKFDVCPKNVSTNQSLNATHKGVIAVFVVLVVLVLPVVVLLICIKKKLNSNMFHRIPSTVLKMETYQLQ